jgi:hypothetical protein
MFDDASGDVEQVWNTHASIWRLLYEAPMAFTGRPAVLVSE